MDLSNFTAFNTPVFGLKGRKLTGRLVDVHDGDTITVIAELFPSSVFKINVRLAGIDASEMTSKSPQVKELAERARMRVVTLLTGLHDFDLPQTGHLTRVGMMNLLQKNVYLVHLHCQDMDKYGRVLADVAIDEHHPHVGMVLLQEGLASPYFGGTKGQ